MSKTVGFRFALPNLRDCEGALVRMRKLGFYKRIKVTEEGITIRNRKVAWSDVLGVRNFNDSVLYQFCWLCPFTTLFLKGGRVIRIPKRFILEGIESKKFDDKYKERFAEYFTVIEFMRGTAVNTRDDKFFWIEWRVVLTVFFGNLSWIIYNIVNKTYTDDVLFHGFWAVLPIGLIWEFMARKKKWK